MPKNKDLKRLVRERMDKTGESYTTARSQLVAKQQRLENEDYATLAGMSEEAIHKATGQHWAWWVQTLDAAGFAKSKHREITKHVEANYDFSAWWAQSVVVGYERIKGLREIGQRREGTYDANKSKTFAVSVERLFAAMSEEQQRTQWLANVTWTLRKETAPKSIRLAWKDGSFVELYFVSKGPEKSSVQIQHRKLATKEEIEERKQEWGEYLEALAMYLANST